MSSGSTGGCGGGDAQTILSPNTSFGDIIIKITITNYNRKDYKSYKDNNIDIFTVTTTVITITCILPIVLVLWVTISVLAPILAAAAAASHPACPPPTTITS